MVLKAGFISLQSVDTIELFFLKKKKVGPCYIFIKTTTTYVIVGFIVININLQFVLFTQLGRWKSPNVYNVCF